LISDFYERPAQNEVAGRLPAALFNRRFHLFQTKLGVPISSPARRRKSSVVERLLNFGEFILRMTN